jgi:hypothetical protein
MECFYHPGAAAVGTCKSCGKGVCRTCAVDLGKGLACRGHCEEDTKALIKLIDVNVRNSPRYDSLAKAGYRNRYLNCAFYIAVGVFCLTFAIFRAAHYGYQPGDLFSGGFGAICFIYGVIVYQRVKASIPPPAVNESTQQ